MKNKKYQRAFKAYKNQCDKALDKLIAKVEPDLRQACEKWGLDFCAGMGTWTVYFGEKSTKQKYKKIEGQYYLLGDPRYLLDFLEPELAVFLELSVGAQSLGSLIPDIKLSKDDYEWVIIQVNALCLDEPTEKPEILTSIECFNENEYAQNRHIPRQLAEVVVAEYNQDWSSGSQLLASLPSLNWQDLQAITG